MGVLGPFQAQSGERRVYFNGHGQSGQKIWVVAGREGKSLVKHTNKIERQFAVDYVRQILVQLKSDGRASATWPDFDVLYQAAELAARDGWRMGAGPVSENDRLDPARGFDGLPDRCELLVDPDADRTVCAHLSEIENLHLVETRLEAGHFVCRDRTGVTLLAMERAARQEFVAGLTEGDGGLFLHAQRIKRSGAQAVVLLEGDIFSGNGAGLGEIASALSFMAVAQGISIVPTANPRHTAFTIARMVRHAIYGFGKELLERSETGLAVGAAADATERVAAALSFLAGIGPGRARQIVDAFPNLRAVANASVDELMAVDFIGRGTAEKVATAFRVEHAKSE